MTAIVSFVLVAVVATGLWYVWRTWLQLCPHCAWVVTRVHHGRLRCPRCHRQYDRRGRLH